jgi:hypothetical protein
MDSSSDGSPPFGGGHRHGGDDNENDEDEGGGVPTPATGDARCSGENDISRGERGDSFRLSVGDSFMHSDLKLLLRCP